MIGTFAHDAAALQRSLRQLDLEAVPVRADRVEVDRLEPPRGESI